MKMQDNIIKVFIHLLDIVDPRWKTNPELVDCLKAIKKHTNQTFTPPTLDDVANELKKEKVRQHREQAEKFWNFYESKNWMIGKNKMKNWKAAIKTWNFEKNNIIL